MTGCLSLVIPATPSIERTLDTLDWVVMIVIPAKQSVGRTFDSLGWVFIAGDSCNTVGRVY